MLASLEEKAFSGEANRHHCGKELLKCASALTGRLILHGKDWLGSNLAADSFRLDGCADDSTSAIASLALHLLTGFLECNLDESLTYYTDLRKSLANNHSSAINAEKVLRAKLLLKLGREQEAGEMLGTIDFKELSAIEREMVHVVAAQARIELDRDFQGTYRWSKNLLQILKIERMLDTEPKRA